MFCIILSFYINPATSYTSNDIIKKGQVYSLVISLMNTGESQLKVLITEALKLLVNQQHSDYNSDHYQCETGIHCHENDHDYLIDSIDIAGFYKQLATCSFSHLRVNVAHLPTRGLNDILRTSFMAEIDPINP